MRNKLFSLTLIICLILGMGIFLSPQKNESVMEKRVLSTNESIQFNNAFASSSEAVLKDQFYFRDDLTHSYYQIRTFLNRGINKVAKRVLSILNITEKSPVEGLTLNYLSDNVIEIGDGYLINKILKYTDEEVQLAADRGYNLNQFISMFPDIKTYIYFPTRLEELLNDDAEYKPLCREAFIRELNEDVTYSALEVSGVEDHKKMFFKSDEHWNAAGAYQGYSDIINMISKDYEIDPPRAIIEEKVFPYEFYGDIASQIGKIGETDHITDYTLEGIGDFDFYVNEEEADFYHNKKQYTEEGNKTVFSDYDLYFGDNSFLREFDFHQEDKPNILIFADSYTNTNMQWIASHFNKTTVIDLRGRWDDFSLKQFVNENDFDIMLFTYSYNTMYFNSYLFISLD